MRHTGRFAVALLICVGLAVAALTSSVSRRDRNGLPVDELLQVENLTDEPTAGFEEQVKLQAEVLGGERRYTAEYLDAYFDPEFIEQLSLADLNDQIDAILADTGPIEFLRVTEDEPRTFRILGIDGAGEAGYLLMSITDDGLIDGLGIVDGGSRRRLATWESTLILIGSWTLLAAALAAWRYRAHAAAWALLAGSIPTLATILVLADSTAVYTLGRVLPPLVVIPAALLLVRPDRHLAKIVVSATAMAAAVIGAVAPFVRDSTLIGHPDVIGRFADGATSFRLLLVVSAGLTVVAMSTAAVVNLSGVRRDRAPMRPTYFVAASVAVMWAAAAVMTGINFGAGGGTWTGASARALTWSALVAVPVSVVFGLVSSSWDRPDLATLVIDLESDNADLQPAISKALADPSLQLLRSPDGVNLVDDSGETVLVAELPEGFALTRIQSGQRLVGGLLHSAELQRDPTRLEAVAAAAGLAMEVGRLNERVVAQLDEVEASRARILAASDIARRRVERDLHDGAQQRLVAVGIRLQRARRLAESQDQHGVAELIEDATREVRGTIEEIRAVSRGAQPALLAERGLATAVDALAERSPVPVQVALSGDRLPSEVEKTAYYVIAEGLTNVAKHSTATAAHIAIDRRDGTVCVSIRDDGAGGAAIEPGSGLEGLNDRVSAVGGTFRIESGPTGTTLKATIPCE